MDDVLFGKSGLGFGNYHRRTTSGNHSKKLRLFEETLLKDWGLLNVVPLNNREGHVGQSSEHITKEKGRQCYSAPASSSHDLPKIGLMGSSAYKYKHASARGTNSKSASHKFYKTNRASLELTTKSPWMSYSKNNWRNQKNKCSQIKNLEVVGCKTIPVTSSKRKTMTRHDIEMMDVQHLLKIDIDEDGVDEFDSVNWRRNLMPSVEEGQMAENESDRKIVPKCDVVDFSNELSTTEMLEWPHLNSSTHRTCDPNSSRLSARSVQEAGISDVGDIPLHSSYSIHLKKPVFKSKKLYEPFRVAHEESKRWSHECNPRNFGIFKEYDSVSKEDVQSSVQRVKLAISRPSRSWSTKEMSQKKQVSFGSLQTHSKKTFINNVTESDDESGEEPNITWPHLNMSRDEFMKRKANIEDPFHKNEISKNHWKEDDFSIPKIKVTITTATPNVDSTKEADIDVRNHGSSSFDLVDKKLSKMARKKYIEKVSNQTNKNSMFLPKDYVGFQHRKFKKCAEAQNYEKGYDLIETKKMYLKVKIREDE